MMESKMSGATFLAHFKTLQLRPDMPGAEVLEVPLRADVISSDETGTKGLVLRTSWL